MPIATDKLRGASDIDQSWRKLPVWAWIVAAVVIAAGGLLRFQGHLWDGGLMLHPDERNIVEAAARLSLQAQPVPDFHAYNGLAVYGPRLAAELEAVLTGTAPPGKVQILLAGRFLSALLSTATIVVVWLIAARLFAPAFALLALSLTAFSPGLIQAAHFGTTESALVFFLCVLILLSVRHLQGVRFGSDVYRGQCSHAGVCIRPQDDGVVICHHTCSHAAPDRTVASVGIGDNQVTTDRAAAVPAPCGHLHTATCHRQCVLYPDDAI
jgi:hypothetical protein